MHDGGPFITLPLVVTKNPETEEHNLGMYRAQVFGPTEVGLHWQMHKHGAEHAEANDGRMPVAICMGGPPEVMFSAIAPLPDNLEEYMFAGMLGEQRLRITKCLTRTMGSAECDVVIEGYTILEETRLEGPSETILDIILLRAIPRSPRYGDYSSQRRCGPDDHRR